MANVARAGSSPDTVYRSDAVNAARRQRDKAHAKVVQTLSDIKELVAGVDHDSGEYDFPPEVAERASQG